MSPPHPSASESEPDEPSDATENVQKEHVIEADSKLAAEAAAARKEVLRLAMKAFRKRLKLTILDDESRLGRGPMSGGHKSSVLAITPPNQFPRDVWEELAEQGKLKRAGRGVYQLTE